MILEKDLNSLSYKEIISIVDSISEEKYRDSDAIYMMIEILKNDSRKNVQSLATKIENRFTKYTQEIARIKSMYEFDSSFGNYKYVAGVDEVGRGPLAGPIVAAAVILNHHDLDEDKMILGLNDSKKLSPEKREVLSDMIIERAISYKISLLDNNIIDNEGIGVCNHKVFCNSCKELTMEPDLVLSDGYLIKGFVGNNKAVIKGDTKSASIAAASIIAKVYRDRLMKDYAEQYPEYGFERNAGYGTEEHVNAIKKYGITPIHRRSFLKGLIG